MFCEDLIVGVDVGVKVEIYVFLNKVFLEGMGILLVLIDFEEVVIICYWVIVFS